MTGKLERHAEQLGALGHPARLSILRYVVQGGPDGTPAGEIQSRLEIPGSTLSHHLDRLSSAGLLTCCLSSCVDVSETPEKDKDGNVVRDQQGRVVTHRRYYFRPWIGSGSSYGGYGSGGGYGGSSYTSRPVPSTGRPSTGSGGSSSRPTSTTTSRGGFGGTSHSTAGS